MHHFIRRLIPLLLLLQFPAKAQTPAVQSISFDTLSLEQLMNIKITVASIKELTPRQSPGIVTYITSEEIRNLGARDLMEVLRQVPGFEFGVDVEGVVGLGIRGNWAHEGKVVLFIDGQEMNESLYSTLQFGNHYPIDNIDRIEIIRGPGSALHGGFAAYAVINIITRKPTTNFEIGVTALNSQTTNDFGRRGANIYSGHAGKNSTVFFNLNATEAQRSHDTYTDINGASYQLQGASGIKNIFLNTGGNIGNLHIRWISNNYTLSGRDEYVDIADRKSNLQFMSNSIETKYEWKSGEKFKLIPRFRFNYENPWSSPKKDLKTDEEPFSIYTTSYIASLTSSYDFKDGLNISGGVSWDKNHSKNAVDGEIFRTTGTNQFNNINLAVFGQILYVTKWANIIAGARYNYNKRYENSLVPRIGITRDFGTFHLKALYSRAFRAPSTQNIDLSENIRPEYTDVTELEAGFKITNDAYITVNAFEIKTKDPIVYYVDSISESDAYTNLSNTGTKGIEAVFQLKKKWGGLDINTSYYVANDGNDISIYSIPEEEQIHLGLAPCKFNFSFRYNISASFQAGTNFTWLSHRYGINALDQATQEPMYKKYPQFSLLNVHLEYRFKNVKGLSMRASVKNLLDQQELFIQPYNSYHAPLPGMGREFQLRISYQNF